MFGQVDSRADIYVARLSSPLTSPAPTISCAPIRTGETYTLKGAQRTTRAVAIETRYDVAAHARGHNFELGAPVQSHLVQGVGTTSSGRALRRTGVLRCITAALLLLSFGALADDDGSAVGTCPPHKTRAGHVPAALPAAEHEVWREL
jgi:hypothetical protein